MISNRLFLTICLLVISVLFITKNLPQPDLQRWQNSVVRLDCFLDTNETTAISKGTGVIINKDLILTNYHVVKLANSIVVTTFKGASYKAEVVAKDIKTDLAILKLLNCTEKFIPLRISDSKIRLKSKVYFIGYNKAVNSTVTKTDQFLDVREGDSFKYVEISEQVVNGDSGSALLNYKGELVGLIASKSVTKGTGYAIPMNQAMVVIKDLLSKGFYDHAVLGVNSKSIPPKAENFKGVIVTNVVNNSPAEKVGIKVKDLILKLDRFTIEKPQEMGFYLLNRKPGDKIRVSYIRNNQLNETIVELESLRKLVE